MSNVKTTRSEEQILIRSITPEGASSFDVGPITVLLGANNAGKTAALRDLVALAGNFNLASKERLADEDVSTRLLRDITFAGKLSIDRLQRGLTVTPNGSAEGTPIQSIGPDLRTPYRETLRAEIKSVLYRPVITARSVRTTALGQIMPLRVAYLASDRCAELLRGVAACSPLQAPESLLQMLHYAAPSVHAELDSAFCEAFPDRHVRLDATQRVNLYLRVAETIPPPVNDPVADARQMDDLPCADEQGAGMQSYLAVVLTMLLCQGRVVLLDQPETGLHPEQAKKLGRWVAQNAPRLGCQVFLATHSPAMLQGILEATGEVSLFRLTRAGDTTRWQSVPPDVGAALARFPLLYAQQALDVLFGEGVVFVPTADDRVVYETVAQRFAGVPHLKFLQTYGARNLAALARTVRKAGLPVAVIAELDVLQSEAGFSELIKSVTGNPPPAPWLATRERLAQHVEGMLSTQELSAARHEVEDFLDQLKSGGAAGPAKVAPGGRVDPREKWSRLQREQMANVPPELRVWVEELLDELKRAGVFLSTREGFQGWMGGEPVADKELALAKTVQTLSRGECPAELKAFVNEIVSFARLLAAPAKATRLNLKT